MASTYTIHHPRGVFETPSSRMAEAFARDGIKVTAVATSQL